jgi:electron transfer flavoprotein alpha subunit
VVEPARTGRSGNSIAEAVKRGGATVKVRGSDTLASAKPLRIAVLVKQVPQPESFSLGSEGRLHRKGIPLEMNPYCRRAVAKGCELAGASSGSCFVFTLGPPSAEDVLRESIAWGADRGVHICDEALAGSDTLATAHSLAAALHLEGPFDLILVGKNSVDGDTGQVGPELAEILDLPFAGGVHDLEIREDRLVVTLEHDDAWEDAELGTPAVISVAERLCEPCKVDERGRASVPESLLVRLTTSQLGPGPWGQHRSRTCVGEVRTHPHERQPEVFEWNANLQMDNVVADLVRRGALPPGSESFGALGGSWDRAVPGRRASQTGRVAPVIGVLAEPGRSAVSAELLGAAALLAEEIDGTVTALAVNEVDPEALGPMGADAVVVLDGELNHEDIAHGFLDWAQNVTPWAVVAPSTTYGREVAGRMAAALDAGLIGDAIDIEQRQGRLVGTKPAFSGALVAEITCTSAVQMVTVRPGVLPVLAPRSEGATVSKRSIGTRGRMTRTSYARDDDVELLARAPVVVGVGAGVDPESYQRLDSLLDLLGAEMAATRKVTDKGWAPRARQVGITGRSIAPRLYVGLGLSGKFNHLVGVRGAGTILAINSDPAAPIFGQCDIGIVGDWRPVVESLESALCLHRRNLGGTAAL